MAMIDQLSEYLVRARTADLPAEVARKGKHHILDTLAAMVRAETRTPGSSLRPEPARGPRVDRSG